ncbi:hypothetical protein [Pedobacter jamesrossensis]|uniref:Lipoprotein n=1 Tax=Pedobacter jamesrossensis TaxID=1908238 RepID=A0ABV8NLG3_9SPHI
MKFRKLTTHKIAGATMLVLLASALITSCSKKENENVCVACTASVSQGSGNAGNVTTSSMENCGTEADVATAEANFRAQNAGSTINCNRK